MQLYKIEVYSVWKKNPIRAEEYNSWDSFVKKAEHYKAEINAEDYKYYFYNLTDNSWNSFDL